MSSQKCHFASEAAHWAALTNHSVFHARLFIGVVISHTLGQWHSQTGSEGSPEGCLLSSCRSLQWNNSWLMSSLEHTALAPQLVNQVFVRGET